MRNLIKKVISTTMSCIMLTLIALSVFSVSVSATESADYEPQRVITTAIQGGGAGLNVSWVNPVAELVAVKIYKVNGYKETELTDASIDNTSNVIVEYTDRAVNADSYATYKIRFEFADGNAREVYTSGMAGDRSNTNFTCNADINEDWRGAVNSMRIAGGGFKSTLDFITGVKADNPDETVMRITYNDTKDANKYYNMSMWGSVRTKAGTAHPGTYKVGMTTKGANAKVNIILQGFRGTWQAIASNFSGTPIGGEDWVYKETQTIKVNDGETLPWNRLIVQVCNFDPGVLLIDNISILRLKDGGNPDTASDWEAISTQEFNFRNTGGQSVTPDPQNVSYEYSTDGVIIDYDIPDVRGIKNGFDNKTDTKFGTYTNVYENINGSLYLRAMLPNVGNTNGKAKINCTVTNDFVVKTFRKSSIGDQDLEGDGSYSGGVSIKPVEPNSVIDSVTLKDEEGNDCNVLKSGKYTASVKARNLNEPDMKGQLIVTLYKGKKMLGIYTTDSVSIPKAPFGTECTELIVNDIIVPSGELSDYSLRVMFWDDPFGNMKSLTNALKIEAEKN